MIRRFANQTFRQFDNRDSGRVFSDLEFHNCRFEDSHISFAEFPDQRTIVRNVSLIDCSLNRCLLGPTVLENVTVENLQIREYLFAYACAFKHVVLRGQLGVIKLCRSMPFRSLPKGVLKKQTARMGEANSEYYRGVDWALDISQAEFASGEVEGVPPDLIRRDPETQMIIRASTLHQGRWREVNMTGSDWPVLLEAYAKEGMGDVILVAPKRSSRFQILLDALHALRSAGIAE